MEAGLLTFGEHDSIRCAEEAFISNYCRVSSAVWCNLGFSGAKTALYLVGWLFATKKVKEVIKFVETFEAESYGDLLNICEEQMKSTEMVNESELIIFKSETHSGNYTRLGASLMRVAGKMCTDYNLVGHILTFLSNFVTSPAMTTWTPFTSTCSIQRILNSEIPNSNKNYLALLTFIIKLRYESIVGTDEPKKEPKKSKPKSSISSIHDDEDIQMNDNTEPSELYSGARPPDSISNVGGSSCGRHSPIHPIPRAALVTTCNDNDTNMGF